MAGLPSMLVPFFSIWGMSLELLAGRLHWHISNGRNRRGRNANNLEFSIPFPEAFHEPISQQPFSALALSRIDP